MDYRSLIINAVKDIDSEYLLRIIYRFIRGMLSNSDKTRKR
ncbi:MAG: hypothetical protein SPE08_08175 [Bariatricus sp.]|nr:hypothetical protein [Bariatricus sp.]